jgi:hypothetical protein
MVIQAYTELENRFTGCGIDLSKVTLHSNVVDRLRAIGTSFMFKGDEQTPAYLLEYIQEGDPDPPALLRRQLEVETALEVATALEEKELPSHPMREAALDAWRVFMTTPRSLDVRAEAASSESELDEEGELDEYGELQDGDGGGVVLSGKQVPPEMLQRIAAELAKDIPDPGPGSDPGLRPVHRATRPLQLQPLYRRFHSSLKF